MRLTIFFAVIAVMFISFLATAQTTTLLPGQTFEKQLKNHEEHVYSIDLKKGNFATCIVMQNGVDLVIDVTDPSGKKIKTFDSPNGKNGAEPVEIEALQDGKYLLDIHTVPEETGNAASNAALADANQGDYTISSIVKLTPAENKKRIALLQIDKDAFEKWILNNAHEIKTVEAGSGSEDLQVLKVALKNVDVVGLGEASHGTSEFFKMKHRLIEFLVKEMGYTSFYLEADMAQCRYINDYVFYGNGNLDTATAVHQFITWRTEEFRDMLKWMHDYNATVLDDKKIKFYGYDFQSNDMVWKGLKKFYYDVDSLRMPELLKLRALLDTAKVSTYDSTLQPRSAAIFKECNREAANVLNDMMMNQGRYEYIAGKKRFEENTMNIRLVLQAIEAFKGGFNDRRDYYMAQNILQLYNNEKPGTKVIVWAHNGHIAKKDAWLDSSSKSMGGYINTVLKNKYYAIGFEFYSGSFQTRNLDLHKRSHDWDIMSVTAPSEGSLPWIFSKTGKDKFFIDFRNNGKESIKNFPLPYQIHSFGSMYSAKEPQTYSGFITDYDGMIYISHSTAAKNFKKVYL